MELKQRRWIDWLIVSIPGLAALVWGFVLPPELQLLFQTTLTIVLVVCIASLMVRKSTIERLAKYRLVRRIHLFGAVALIGLLCYFLGYSTVVASYGYGNDKGKIFVPATLSISSGSRTHPYIDCTESYANECIVPEGTLRQARTAQAVGDLVSDFGTGAVAIPQDLSWYEWLVALLACYVVTAVSLTEVFGLIRIRRLSVRDFASATAPQDRKGGMTNRGRSRRKRVNGVDTEARGR